MTVLTNLIPTAFATFIEPFWFLLNRLLCILQPFDDLRKGDARAEQTINARYTSVTPQLAFWRAFRAKHYLLALICAVALSTSVLAVALSGLFNEKQVLLAIPSTTTMRKEGVFDGSPFVIRSSSELASLNTGYKVLDNYYVAIANLSQKASLPPWVDKNNYYIPFDLPIEPDGENATEIDLEMKSFSAQTRGFGLDVKCTSPSASGDGDTFVFRPVYDSDARAGFGSDLVEFLYTHKGADGREYRCGASQTAMNTRGVINNTLLDYVYPVSSAGPQRFEGITQLTSEFFENIDYCGKQFLAGWARLGPATSTSNLFEEKGSDYEGRSLDSTFVHCTTSLKTALFNVEVDLSGRIISANQSGEYATDLEFLGGHEPDEIESPVDGLLRQISYMVAHPDTTPSLEWSNDSYAHSWLSSAIIAKRGSDAWLSIDASPPTPEEVIPEVEYIYRQVAAIIMSFDQQLFKTPAEPIEINVNLNIQEERIFLETASFWICISLLAIQLLTLFIFYWNRPGRFLPRMPLSIASIISFVSASHAVQDLARDDKDQLRFGYGRFRGVDGKTHVGIEKEPLVIPLQSENPERRKKGTFETIRRLSNPMSPKVWI